MRLEHYEFEINYKSYFIKNEIYVGNTNKKYFPHKSQSSMVWFFLGKSCEADKLYEILSYQILSYQNLTFL